MHLSTSTNVLGPMPDLDVTFFNSGVMMYFEVLVVLEKVLKSTFKYI